MSARRRATVDRVPGAVPAQFQVRYWDPRVEVWCDFGDPVEAPWKYAAAVVEKLDRCERGENP